MTRRYAGAPRRSPRRQWWLRRREPADSPERQAMLQRYAGAGISADFVDRAGWLTPEEDMEGQWIDALERCDRQKTLAPLLEPLRAVVPPVIFPHLENLARRTKLTAAHCGTRATPSYDRSRPERLIRLAVGNVRDAIRAGTAPATAIADAARQFGMPQRTLRNAVLGKRGSSRRRRK